MKKLLTIILISLSIFVSSQESIYSLNSGNIHLINFASFSKSENFEASLYNSFEYYNSDKMYNTINLNVNYNFLPNFEIGSNIAYNYLGEKNNSLSFDAILKYKAVLNYKTTLVVAANIGIIASKYNYMFLKPRYTFKEITAVNISYKSQDFNLGIGTVLIRGKQSAGVYFNHINTPSLPFENDKIPIKFTAFIRNSKGRFSSILSYSYQDEFLYNPTDLDYYSQMLNYLGVDLSINLGKVSLSAGYKYLSNYNDIISVGANLNLNRLNLKYNLSFMIQNENNTAQFHQVGISYYLVPYVSRRRLSGLMYL